jgi:signal transduction histidine kinase/DNA-binding response OmpR family regulator
VYVAAGLVALGARMAGILTLAWLPGLALLSLGGLSALLCHELYRRGAGDRLTPGWMAVDLACITWGVHLTGGLESPWYLWYLSNTAAAAFVAGRRGAIAVGALDALAYLGSLWLTGQVMPGDPRFWAALGRLLLLFGSGYFFLRGVTGLHQQNLLVRRLQLEQEQRVAQLTELAQDLEQGTRALAEANVQIRHSDRMKSQFLANMSHELRTPLNSIIGFSEILVERLGGQVQERYVKFLRNIHVSGQHLLGIINDILDLSRVESGKTELQPEPFRLATVIEGVLNVMHGMANKQGIVFELDVPATLPVLEADPVKLKQILYNLLNNAVKFSHPGGSVRVAARHLEAPASPLKVGSLCLEVSDRGIGIPADQHAAIFEEFHRVESKETEGIGGTGLGLTLVRRLVELHAGVVSVESAPGRGSTFRVFLPLAPRPRRSTLELSLPRPEGGRRVLVVEDDLLAYAGLAQTLGTAGYDPVRTGHGHQQVLELARAVRPALITLDLGLPGLSGWEVLKALKRDRETRGIPVVIVSMRTDHGLGLALGADDYFLAPLDRERLVARLRQIAPRAAGASPRVLVVDDEPVAHALVEDALAPEGYAVDHARSRREGLERARSQRPDVVVLDLVLDDLGGFGLLAGLRDREETASVPVVALTGRDLVEAERERLGARIEALLRTGPEVAAQLLATIRTLEARRQRQVAHAG